MLSRSKDAAVALAVRAVLNAKLDGIGRITELSVDTAQQAAHIKMQLAGEGALTEIWIERYSLVTRGGTPALTVLAARSSREWLQAAMQTFVVGKPIRLPAKARSLVGLLS